MNEVNIPKNEEEKRKSTKWEGRMNEGNRGGFMEVQRRRRPQKGKSRPNPSYLEGNQKSQNQFEVLRDLEMEAKREEEEEETSEVQKENRKDGKETNKTTLENEGEEKYREQE